MAVGTTVRRGTLPSVVAVLMALTLAAPTSAASWMWSINVEASEDGPTGFPGGLAVLPPNTAVAIYADYSYYGDNINYGAYVRRSTDSGATWRAPITLSTEDTGGLAIAAHGTNVDAVWVDKRSDLDEAEILYARSTNSGASFAPAKVFSSPTSGYPKDVAVARGPDGTVAVAWTTKFTSYSNVRVRVSHDGGASFGPTTTLATGQLRDVKLAIGDGIIYAVYIRKQSGSRMLELRYSPNNGSNWTPIQQLADDVYNGWYNEVDTAPAIAAEGDQAYVGYVSTANQFWYRRTADRGAGWSLAGRLSGRLKTQRVAMSLANGVARVAYSQCESASGCWLDRIRYRTTSDGILWSSPQKSATSDIGLIVAGIGRAANPIILYMLPPDGSGCCEFGTHAAIKV